MLLMLPMLQMVPMLPISPSEFIGNIKGSLLQLLQMDNTRKSSADYKKVLCATIQNTANLDVMLANRTQRNINNFASNGDQEKKESQFLQ